MGRKILVTGTAGFIGANLCMELFRREEGRQEGEQHQSKVG